MRSINKQIVAAILVAITASTMLSTEAFARKITTTVVRLPTLQCGSCKTTIEGKLKNLRGLKSITVDVDRKEATVVFDADVTTVAKIERAIVASGYNANNRSANPKAQRALPGCCQPGGHE